MEQEKLNRIRRAAKERQAKLDRVAVVKAMLSSTRVDYTNVTFDPALFNDKRDVDTAIYFFIEHIYEDFAEYIMEDDYFYYLCDFTEHCKSIGIKFPDTSHLECYN